MMNSAASPKEIRTPWPTSLSEAASSKNPAEDVLCYLKDYARQKPEAAALWCFGIGFILGWKLKPW